MFASPTLLMKDTVFYKKQIQQKLAQSIAVMPISQDLPITREFISQLFNNYQNDDQSSDQYFEQIQYFINQPLQTISSHRSAQIQNQLQFYFKQSVKIMKVTHQLNQQNNFYFYYEISQKSAVVFVYKYQVRKEASSINLYPCFEKNSEFLQQKTCCLIKRIEEINTYFEFQSIKIQSILLLNHLIIVSIQVGYKRFQLLFKQQQPHSQQLFKNNLNYDLVLLIKQQLFQVLIQTIRNHKTAHKFVIIYSFNQAQHTICFETSFIKSVTLEKQLNLTQKILLIYECFLRFGITLNWDVARLQLKQSIFSKGKQKTYLQNIIYVVNYAMKNREELKQLGIQQQFLEIVKQSRDKQIMNQFQICYLMVKQKMSADKLKDNV